MQWRRAFPQRYDCRRSYAPSNDWRRSPDDIAVLKPVDSGLAARDYRPPNPADCIDCREMSAVDAIPAMRSLKSSALEAFSSAVS